MATGTNGIATLYEAYYIAYGSYPRNNVSTSKCVTKSLLTNGYSNFDYDGSKWYSLEANKVTVSGSYSDNQCVKYSDLSKTPSSTLTVSIKDNTSGKYLGAPYIKVGDGAAINVATAIGSSKDFDITTEGVIYWRWSYSPNSYWLGGYPGTWVVSDNDWVSASIWSFPNTTSLSLEIFDSDPRT